MTRGLVYFGILEHDIELEPPNRTQVTEGFLWTEDLIGLGEGFKTGKLLGI
jgi:hypothetical protein